jgi:hypothetical protein
VPDCLTPWAVFNTSQELSFFASALKAVGLNGAGCRLQMTEMKFEITDRLMRLGAAHTEAVDSPYVTATFFAPTNAAFAALLHSFATTQDQLLADPSM